MNPPTSRKEIRNPKLRIALVPYISPSSSNGYNEGDDLPTFVLARHQKIRPKGSNKL